MTQPIRPHHNSAITHYQSNTSMMIYLCSAALLTMGQNAFAQDQSSVTSPPAPIVPPLVSTDASSAKTTQMKGSLLTIKNNDAGSPDSLSLLETSNPNAHSSLNPDPQAQATTDDTDNFALPKDDKKDKENISEPKNAFQQFVAGSLGYTLPIFGRSLFTTRHPTFTPQQDTAVPGDYIIGASDEIHIRASGSLDINYLTKVDKNGKISLPHIGSMAVAGLHYSELQSAIEHNIRRLYKDFELYVSLGQLRSIRVYLVGHVKRPGAYTVSSLSTLVDTLLNAGGPSATGSLRHIEVKRAGRLITSFDLYDLLLNGDTSKDVHLMSDDVIYVAPIGKLVALNGSINEPAIYEIRDHETLGNVLRFAGGVSAVASTSVSIERIVDHTQRTVQQVSLNPNSLKQPVKEGDLITVADISRKFEHVITLRGHVASPIRMPWHQGMRIHDVIPSKDALITPDYYASLEHYTQPESAPLGTAPLGTAPLGTAPPLKTEIHALLQEPNFDYAVIERLKSDLSREIIPFNLGKALDGDKNNNLPLKPDDVITVFSKDDISVPRSQRTGFVRLEGEFKASGIYRIEPNETLRQIIEKAGGVTLDAQLYALQIQRESVRERQIKRYNEWLNQMEQDLLRSQNQKTSLSQEEATLHDNELKNREKLIQRLRAIHPSGRIVLNFKDNFNPQTSDLPELILEDGDKIFLPARSNTVSIVGAVVNDGTFLYQSGKLVSDYVSDAGGATEQADTSSLYVIHTDGSIVTPHKSLFGWLGNSSPSIQPGDTIVLPEKVGGQTLMSTLKDFATIFYQFGLGAAAVHVLKN